MITHFCACIAEHWHSIDRSLSLLKSWNGQHSVFSKIQVSTLSICWEVKLPNHCVVWWQLVDWWTFCSLLLFMRLHSVSRMQLLLEILNDALMMKFNWLQLFIHGGAKTDNCRMTNPCTLLNVFALLLGHLSSTTQLVSQGTQFSDSLTTCANQ